MDDAKKNPVEAAERAAIVLTMMRETADVPMALVDPLAMVSLLEWVIDGLPRPFPPDRAKARAKAMGAAMRAGAALTISTPSVSPSAWPVDRGAMN